MITKTSFSLLLTFFITQSSLATDNTIELVRLGTQYGGWTIPKNLCTAQSICYCAGAGEDISFDVELIKNFGCHVYTFDPTPRSAQHINYIKKQILSNNPAYINNNKHFTYDITVKQFEQLHFYPIGLWNSNTVMKFYKPKDPKHVSHSILNLQKTNDFFEAQCKTLATIMAELGHDHIDLLKLDIEGAEYAIIDSIIADQLNITCICMEFDEFAGANKQNNTDLAGSLERANRRINLLLENGYRIIHQKGMTDITFLKN